VRVHRALAILCASLASGCDAIPSLYVIDASADVGAPGQDAADATQETGPACTAISCPSCPPFPGTCCTGGIP
jgi:hypothetical protein